jgi:hypothetical protein
MSEFFVGLDLGQASDYTALVIVERVQVPDGPVNTNLEQPTRTELRCQHAERLPLGVPYPAVVTHVTTLLDSRLLKGRTSLVVDHTGVGRPVFDMFEASPLSCPLTGITITGGDTVSWDSNRARVPKRDLIGAAQVALQNRVLLLAPSMPHAAMLVAELRNFRVKIDVTTAHDSYSAWRENIHDDLVLSLSMACWMAQETRPIGFIKIHF